MLRLLQVSTKLRILSPLLVLTFDDRDALSASAADDGDLLQVGHDVKEYGIISVDLG